MSDCGKEARLWPFFVNEQASHDTQKGSTTTPGKGTCAIISVHNDKQLKQRFKPIWHI